MAAWSAKHRGKTHASATAEVVMGARGEHMDWSPELWISLASLLLAGVGVYYGRGALTPERGGESQRSFVDGRKDMGARFGELSEAAADIHVRARPALERIGTSTLLWEPAMRPPRPVPLRQVTLTWQENPPPPDPALLRATRRYLPQETRTRRYQRYSSAMGDLARPALFEDRPSFRLLRADWSHADGPRPFRLDQLVVGPGVPLTDAQWARIEPLLPDRTPKRGGRWREHREVIDAIAFKFQTGTQWVHLPEKYGNWRGVYNRLRMWAVDGTWERVFTALVAQADADEDVNWAVSVDSTVVRAHQHAAGARKKGPRPASRTTTPSAGPAAD